MMRVIFESPTLVAGFNQIQSPRASGSLSPMPLMGTAERQAGPTPPRRRTLTRQALSGRADLPRPPSRSQGDLLQPPAGRGTPLSEAGRGLMEDLELAFDLLERGFGDRFTR